MAISKELLKIIENAIALTGISTTSVENTFYYIRNSVDSTDKNTIISLYNKYKDYVLYYRLSHMGQEEKYISKQDKMLGFSDFVFTEAWKREYDIPKNDFTINIFGKDFNFKKLYQFYLKNEKIFQQKLNEGHQKYLKIKQEYDKHRKENKD